MTTVTLVVVVYVQAITARAAVAYASSGWSVRPHANLSHYCISHISRLSQVLAHSLHLWALESTSYVLAISHQRQDKQGELSQIISPMAVTTSTGTPFEL